MRAGSTIMSHLLPGAPTGIEQTMKGVEAKVEPLEEGREYQVRIRRPCADAQAAGTVVRVGLALREMQSAVEANAKRPRVSRKREPAKVRLRLAGEAPIVAAHVHRE